MADPKTWSDALAAIQAQSQPQDTLASINSSTLGTTMPTVTLPNGQKVQTGTIGALLVNIKAYDEVLAQTPVEEERKRELEERMGASLKLLKSVGMFDLFTPEEWVKGSSPGRRFVGEKALAEGY